VLRAAENNIAARIQVGPAPTGVEFAPDGKRAYVAVSGANTVLAIDTATKRIAGRARTGHVPAPRASRPTAERSSFPIETTPRCNFSTPLRCNPSCRRRSPATGPDRGPAR